MSQPPHPTPGASGEGAPIAPPKWRWRCGNRLRDMYFYSPQGKTYRSKKELAAYLGTLADGPSPEDYCWNVTAEIVKTGVWNKEAVTPKTPKTPKAPKTPKSESKKADTETPAKKPKRGDTGTTASPPMASPSTPAAHNAVQFSQVEPLAIRAPGPVMSKKVTTGSLTSRAKVKAKKNETKAETRAETKADTKDEKKTETKAEILEPPLSSPGSAPPEPRTFKEILAEPSSFKWLYHQDTIGKFLEEAKKLDGLDPAEISEMRKLLVDRNPQMGNMSKYPNNVLKIFLRLLGTDGLSAEPSDTLGKVELADLCVKLAKA